MGITPRKIELAFRLPLDGHGAIRCAEMVLPMQRIGLTRINIKSPFPQVVVEVFEGLNRLLLEADEKGFAELGAVSKIKLDFHEMGA